MARYNKIERIGINAVEQIVIGFEWIWREQTIADMGIDAHIELVDGNPTGRLIAVQVKTGSGNFTETNDAFVYYGDLVHLDYWTGHSLPVILVAHLPETNTTLWAAVNEQTVERTKKGWKVEIRKSNVFGRDSKQAIARFFDGTPAQQRLRKLAIDEPLMRHIKNGGKVSLELEVESYRLELELNDLGESFLVVSNFLADEPS